MSAKIVVMSTGKRSRKKTAKTKKVTKPFRPPRNVSNAMVIPGLLHQTKTEKKVLFTGTADPVNTFLALNSTGSVVGINLIQVGSSMFNRIGRKIEMRSVRLTMKLTALAVTRNTGFDYGRVMIIYDRQTNGAFPVMATILSDTDQSANNTTESASGLNMNNRERFVTILDKKIVIPQVTNTAGAYTNVVPSDMPIMWDDFRQLRGLTTHYGADSNPAVIGDITTGGLYLISLAQNVAGAENFQMFFNVRLKYTDV